MRGKHLLGQTEKVELSRAQVQDLLEAGDICDSLDLTELGDHCGDGSVAGGEACDDTNLVDGDGCSALCAVEPCWACSGKPSSCAPVGSGACDDNNACTINDSCAGDGSCGGTPDVGAPCNDGQLCTTSDACTAEGSCAGAPVVCEACLGCDQTLGCVPAPRSMCKHSPEPRKSIHALRSATDDARDRVLWRWNKGEDLPPAEVGDPSDGGDVIMCIYGLGPSLHLRATMPGGSLWSGGATRVIFKNSDADGDGISVAQIKPGFDGKASAKLKGKGANLSPRPFGLPSLALPVPLRVQLHGEGNLFLETIIDETSVLQNDPARGVFKARGAFQES
jgi:cysteine-rich repeat protein